MVEQVFGALFVVTLAAPAAAVIIGVLLLAWPRRNETRPARVGHHSSVRV